MLDIQFTDEIVVEVLDSNFSDSRVCVAARTSTAGAGADDSERYGLINALMRDRHGTPFEHMNATFRVTAPIFVWREHHRHRSGFCVAGSTRVPVGSGKDGRTKTIEDIYRDWHLGVPDSLGRNRKLPSCRNLATRTVNLDTGLVEAARMVDVFQSGVKPMIWLRWENGKGLRCTREHRVWTPEGWVKAGDLQVGDLVGRIGLVAYGEAPRFYSKKLREGIGIWTSQQRDLIQEVDTCHRCEGVFSKSDLELDHVIPVCEDLKLALDRDNLAPICAPCHDVKSREETSHNYENRRQRANGVRFEKVTSIEDGGEEMTYDLEMPGPYHNFIANGLVVHNSYNEESGRYKQLDPVFYVPGETRPIAKVEGTRNMDYVLEKGTADQHALIANAMWATCSGAYRQYEAMLDAGIVREVARMVLPVNIMSTCIVTCNARSLMHFLSLRQRHDDAKFPSKPQYEINLVANGYERLLAEEAPLVHRSYVENGRVAP
ncbi:ThyX-like thymidylate synthase [Mycobacterium phage Colt]|nr:ThyX-like thymidylate synthase [Mycobacterium phage Colt]